MKKTCSRGELNERPISWHETVRSSTARAKTGQVCMLMYGVSFPSLRTKFITANHKSIGTISYMFCVSKCKSKVSLQLACLLNFAIPNT